MYFFLNRVTDFAKFTINWNPLLLNPDLKAKVSYVSNTKEFMQLMKPKHFDYFYIKIALLGTSCFDCGTLIATSVQQICRVKGALQLVPPAAGVSQGKGQTAVGIVADAGGQGLAPLTILYCSPTCPAV